MTNDPITCLTNSLNEAQETIRAFDLKAEILALVVTLALGLLSKNFGNKLDYSQLQIFIGISCVVSGLIAISLIGIVLYPSKEPFKRIDKTDFTPSRTYYVNTDSFKSKIKVSELLERIQKTDWQSELTYELLKCSTIRDRKHYWFVMSLRVAGLTLLLAVIFWLGMFNNV